MCYPPDHPIPQLAGQPKGVQQVLTEQGLWQHYTNTRLKDCLPVLRLRCKECTKTGAIQDAESRASAMKKNCQAEGFFTENNHSQNPPETDEPTATASSNSNNCCWSKTLASQSDFKAERPFLQSIIEDAGHTCLFLPKFHCELNPIELLWAYVKQGKKTTLHMYILLEEKMY
jgi:hypothetical protein